MGRNLDGIKETIDFDELQGILVYDNVQEDDYSTHWHSSLEIIMVKESTYGVTVSDTEYVLNPGDIMLIAPGALHEIKSTHGRRTIVLVDLSSLNILSKAISPILSFIHPALLINRDVNPSVHTRCTNIINSVQDFYFGDEFFKEVDIYALLLQLITIVGKSLAVNTTKMDETYQNKPQAYVDKFVRICEYIDTHYSEDLSLEKMAELAGFSKYHFERLFKNFTGITFYKYLNRVRIAQSRALITNPSLTMTEIALKSGFNSSSTFIRMFKQINGCTPTEFKRNYKPNMSGSDSENQTSL